MSKLLKVLLGILTVIIIVGIVISLYLPGIYHNFVAKDASVKTAWSQVAKQYQRRVDLVQNLVDTVKGYPIHETEDLEAVIKARAEATQTQVNINDSDSFTKFKVSQGTFSDTLSRIMMVVAQYPDLRANKNLLEFQVKIEDTENRISVARKTYNETAKDYNTFIRQFPNNLFAGMFGFKEAGVFGNQEGSDIAPVVDVN